LPRTFDRRSAQVRHGDLKLPDSRPELLILGSRIFAEEVADLVGQADAHRLAGFVENQDRARCDSQLLQRPVHWIDDISPLAPTHLAVCAIGTNQRRALVEQVARLGFGYATVEHPSACVSPTATIGSGCVLSAGVIVATQTQIGEQTILNRGALIGHHTRIGRFVTISPGVNVAGCVTIGDGAYVGMGAIVLDRISVGTGAVVAAGAVLTSDVPPHTQVMGVPARVVKEGVDGR
jgi:acetyltransferase EpsM